MRISERDLASLPIDLDEATARESSPDDSELLVRIASGDGEAFDRFVDRYGGRLVGYLRRRISADRSSQLVDDLAQETFLRVFRAAKGGRGCRGAASVATWLFTIANNVAQDHARSNHRRPVTLASDLTARSGDLQGIPSREGSPAAKVERIESDRWVDSVLATLPAEQAEAISLKVIAQLRFSEVAEVVGAPVSTVKSRVAYGLKKIAAMLKEKRELS